MKNIVYFLIFIAGAFAAACSDDDNAQPVTVAALGDQWKLIHVGGSVAGISENYAPGTITWDFDVENNTVSVVNNNSDETRTDFFETGNYTYGYVPNDVNPGTCAMTLRVSAINFGCAAIEGNTLTLTQGESDGYTLTFTR